MLASVVDQLPDVTGGMIFFDKTSGTTNNGNFRALCRHSGSFVEQSGTDEARGDDESMAAGEAADKESDAKHPHANNGALVNAEITSGAFCRRRRASGKFGSRRRRRAGR